MTSVLDVPGLQGPPDIGAALQMLSEGLQERRVRRADETKRLLSQNIGSRLAGGDMAGAADAAFQSGDMKTGMDITAMGKEDKQKLLSTVGRYAAMADSPDKYQRIVPILTKMLGPEFAQEYGSFEQREALIAETLSLEDQFKLEDRTTKEQERTSKAPDVVEIFDPVTGQPQKATWDAEAGKFVPLGGVKASTKSNGVQVITHPDGTTETIVGGEGGTALTGPTANKVQERAINTAEMGSRIAGVMQNFKPEYQTVGTKLANWWRSGKAKFDPSSLGPGETKSLEEFVNFRSGAFENLSTTLKEMSGAAVTPQEYDRLVQSMPSPGSGMFNGILDGDDPVTFKRKMDGVADRAQAALARYQYYQTIGIPSSLDQIPLTNVKKVGEKWYVKNGDQVFEVGANAAQP